MKAPQVIWISLAMLNLGFVAALHGQPREENYSFWLTLTAASIHVALLKWGGFFK